MSLKKNRGFTLIELLVVIAIIGILSSVVLASLNNARDKGHDASARASINNIRAAMEVWYDDNTASYDTGCVQADPDIAGLIAAADTENGASVDTDCQDTATGYAAEIQLRNGDYFCVDWTGDTRLDAAPGVTAVDDISCAP